MRFVFASQANVLNTGPGGIYSTFWAGDISFALNVPVSFGSPGAMYAFWTSGSDITILATITLNSTPDTSVSLHEASSISGNTGDIYTPYLIDRKLSYTSSISLQQVTSYSSSTELRSSFPILNRNTEHVIEINLSKKYVLSFSCSSQSYTDIGIMFKEMPIASETTYIFK